MTDWKDFLRSQRTGVPAQEPAAGNTSTIPFFNEPRGEYEALVEHAAITDRSYRFTLEAAGRDRLTWLHNLTTNQIKNLGRNEGVYTFALNNQGRILFDLNVINTGDSLWLDIDERFRPIALKHLNKYMITEDVALRDRSLETIRIGLCGPKVPAVLDALGAPHAATMAALSLTGISWRSLTIPMIRHDFCGTLGVELFVPADSASAFWTDLTSSARSDRVIPVGEDAIQIRRIEAGIPWPGHEITDEYLPAETGQLDRAVSYTKGCYLGQEVVERMRSRHVVARLLSTLHVDGETVPPLGAAISTDAQQVVGSVTSACRSIALNRVIALAYLKTAVATAGTKLRVGCDSPTGAPVSALATVVPLVSGQH